MDMPYDQNTIVEAYLKKKALSIPDKIDSIINITDKEKEVLCSVLQKVLINIEKDK